MSSYGDAQRDQSGREYNTITKTLKVGEALTFRPLPRNGVFGVWDANYQFWYPGWNVANGSPKRTPINISGGYFDTAKDRSDAERAFLELHRLYYDKRRAQSNAVKNPLLQIGPEKGGYTYGPSKVMFGCLGEYKGDVRPIVMPDATYEPTPRQEVDKGIRHFSQIVENGKLIYTPFLTRFKVTATESKGTNALRGNSHWTNYFPTPLIEDKFKGLLSGEFGQGCIWVHPDDLEPVQIYVKKMIKAQADGDFFAIQELIAPYFRAYPADNGDVVFVALMHDVPPVRFNVLETEAFTQGLLDAVKAQTYVYDFDPSTQLSLFGGYYYRNERGKLVETTLEEIGKGFKSVDEEGNATTVINGKEVQAGWWAGRLWENRFNPFVYAEWPNLFIPYKTAAWLRDEAVRLGIPTVDCDEDSGEIKVIGNPPEPVDFASYFQQSRQAVQTQSVNL